MSVDEDRTVGNVFRRRRLVKSGCLLVDNWICLEKSQYQSHIQSEVEECHLTSEKVCERPLCFQEKHS